MGRHGNRRHTIERRHNNSWIPQRQLYIHEAAARCITSCSNSSSWKSSCASQGCTAPRARFAPGFVIIICCIDNVCVCRSYWSSFYIAKTNFVPVVLRALELEHVWHRAFGWYSQKLMLRRAWLVETATAKTIAFEGWLILDIILETFWP